VVVDLKSAGDELGELATFPNGTLTVYARRGNAANPEQFDGMAVSELGQPTVVAIEDPTPGIWYITVQNNLNMTVPYSIKASTNICWNNGVGPSCNYSYTDLTGWVNATVFTGVGDYQYFLIRNTNQLVVGTGTQDLDETAPTVLASYLVWPTNSSYMIAAANGTTNYLFANTTNNVTWMIGVWANDGQEYWLWANAFCPDNCEGSDYPGGDTHGVCNQYLGVCECSDHYGDLTCTRTGLAVVWIVLIVIAAAIVLAIAIGVPVALYLRNRRRTRYERV